jgi:phenylacetate-CoA ligase
LRAVNWLYLNGILPVCQPAQYRGLAAEMHKQEAFERRSLAENQETQWQSLTRLLKHAYDTTPFYRQRFDAAGMSPQQFSSPQDLQKLPALTREDLRLHQDDLWSRVYQREMLPGAATGGTTDIPVPLLRSPESLLKKSAVHLRFNSWAGMWPGDKILYLWGARIDFAQTPSWRWKLYDRYINRRVWAPASLLNEQILESFRQLLNQFRPRIIYAYPTPLAHFAEYLRDCGRAFHHPVSAICTAEPVLDHQRQVIEQVLGCRVFEMYGSRESGMIAAQCEYGQGLHLNPHAAYLEFVPLDGEGPDGVHEIFITDLLNYGMPFIRYKINDCALLSAQTCKCGRGYPILAKIIGRTADMFLLPNGDRVPGVTLHRLIAEDCPGFKKLQIIQDTLCDFRVRFVPGSNFQQPDLSLLTKRLGQRFGSSLHWNLERVDDIERERSGKTRFCISHVSSSQALPQAVTQETRR